MLKKLDELFSMQPLYRVGSYQKEIHEMTEMAAVDFGQCAISNQPSFHIPYLKNHFNHDTIISGSNTEIDLVNFK